MRRFSTLWLLALIVSFQLALAPATPTGEPEGPRPKLVITQVADAHSSEMCCPLPWPPPPTDKGGGSGLLEN